MSFSRPPALDRPVRSLLLAAPPAALAGACCDLVLAAPAARSHLHGAGDHAWFLAHLLTAHLLAAFGLCLALGATLWAWRRLPGPPPVPGGGRHGWAATAVAAGAVLAAVALAAAASAGAIRAMANPLLAAAASGLVAAGAAAVATVTVGPLAWVAARRLLGRTASPLAVVAVAGGAALAGGAAWLGPRVEWGAVPLGAAGAPLAAWAVLALASRRPPPAALAGVAACLTLAGAVQALGGFPGSAGAGAALLAGPPLASAMVRAGRRALDADGDGYSRLLGGGDCDDDNPLMGPGAEEVPGNGIDDDCLDGDAPAPPAAAPPPAAGPAEAGGAPAPAGDRPNILMILVDTLRADHLGVHGYARDTTPRIDRLARGPGGVRFARAYAQAPHTPRSIPSIFTSRLPSRIPFDGPGRAYPRLLDEAVTLGEALQGAGYRTEGVFSHFYWQDGRNVLQGFDRVDNAGALDIKGSNRDVAAPRIHAAYAARLEALSADPPGRPWFLLIHYFEPHSTYMRHPAPHDFGGGWMDKYDGEVHFADSWVGRTLDALDASPAAARTVVVLTSDHGEGNGEHGFKWHGQHLYDEVQHVPLIWRMPGEARQARVVDVPAALMDIAPTLSALSGAPPPPEWEGRSLLPALRGEALPPVPIRMELLPYPGWQEHIQAVLDWPLKLLRNRTRNTVELYDLAADPRERTDLSAGRPDDVARLRALLAQPAPR